MRGLLTTAVATTLLALVGLEAQQPATPKDAAKDGTTELHWAVHRDDVDAVDRIIRAGADVNATNRYGHMPLALAALNGHAIITERLLQAGANPNAPLPGGETLLMTAARTGNPDVVKALLARGADVNATEPTTGQTPLMWAAAESHSASVKALLAAGADVRARSKGNRTAFFFAVRKGDIESVRALIAAGVNVDETLEPELVPSCIDCPELPPGTTFAPRGDTMLVLAIVNGHFELADVLLQNGADPNAAGTRWAPLHALARVRNYEDAQYPAPVPTGRLDSLELARRLIARGADVNARAMTRTAGRPGGDQNYVEFMGATPFFLTAKAADIRFMRVLLGAGADPQTPTFEKTTPLMVAAGIGCVPGQWIEPESDVLQAAKLLVEELGADIQAVNVHGETALHGAAYRGANSVVQYLVDKGAKLDVKDNQGHTPLAVAEGVAKPLAIGGPPAIVMTSPHTVPLLKKLMSEALRHSGGQKPY
jgi:ankyrin repeat protein